MSIVYVGMDVHKNSYSLCAIDGSTGEILGEDRISPEADFIERFINKVSQKIEGDVEVITGYEAGCLGYSLYHELAAKDITCVILAPSTMAKSSKDKRVKNDRRDARNIATNLQNNTYKSVYVATHKDIEVKSYIRMMKNFKDQAKKIKQQVNAFLLYLGIRYPGKSRWVPAHFNWLKSVELNEFNREILNEYLDELEQVLTKIERFEARLVELSKDEEYEQSVNELRCLKGINTTAAMTLHVEVSDFNRFPNAKAFTSFCGLSPAEDSSGDKTKRLSITKQGNSVVRSTLVEAAQVLVRGAVGKKGKRLKAKQSGQDVRVIRYADDAVERLQKKFHRLILRGVNRNVAITAIARELACFVWGIETGNIE